MKKILVVDDDLTIQRILKNVIENSGFEVFTASDGKEAFTKVKKMKFDVLITDLNMPHLNGIELTQKVLEVEPELIVIFITAYGTIRSAVEAIKLGAFDYLTKPIDNNELILSVNRGIDKLSLIKENILLKKQLKKTKPEPEFISENDRIKIIFGEANAVANSDSMVLITGEKGTGKEYLAKYIHNKSKRSNNQFISVDCESIPEDMIENELFGSFKNDNDNSGINHSGYLEIADNGTIFLNEITKLNPIMQLKLLQVLKVGYFTKPRDNRIISTSARIIASSGENLLKLTAEGKFNQNLYYKINVFEFHIPSLRERPEDILFYFSNFVKLFCNTNDKGLKTVSSQVQKILINYSWPGNILELRNIAERATILCDDNMIMKEHLPAKICNVDGIKEPVTSKDFLENKQAVVKEFETNFLIKYLKIHRGNVTAVSREINYHPVTLRQKITKLGIDPKEFKQTNNK
ncbi:MAG TPA: sigma-54 dependent transcriptional regulator [Ignavibacteria bacterium]